MSFVICRLISFVICRLISFVICIFLISSSIQSIYLVFLSSPLLSSLTHTHTTHVSNLFRCIESPTILYNAHIPSMAFVPTFFSILVRWIMALCLFLLLPNTFLSVVLTLLSVIWWLLFYCFLWWNIDNIGAHSWALSHKLNQTPTLKAISCKCFQFSPITCGTHQRWTNPQSGRYFPFDITHIRHPISIFCVRIQWNHKHPWVFHDLI